jgi:hypothetical protein
MGNGNPPLPSIPKLTLRVVLPRMKTPSQCTTCGQSCARQLPKGHDEAMDWSRRKSSIFRASSGIPSMLSSNSWWFYRFYLTFYHASVEHRPLSPRSLSMGQRMSSIGNLVCIPRNQENITCWRKESTTCHIVFQNFTAHVRSSDLFFSNTHIPLFVFVASFTFLHLDPFPSNPRPTLRPLPCSQHTSDPFLLNPRFLPWRKDHFLARRVSSFDVISSTSSDVIFWTHFFLCPSSFLAFFEHASSPIARISYGHLVIKVASEW